MEIFQVVGRMNQINIVIKEWVVRENKCYRPFNFVKIYPKENNHSSTIALHTPIIIWSTRGITRPGFINKLCAVMRDHQPWCIILLEIRATKYQFHSVWHQGGGLNMWWLHAPGYHHTSGTVVMWDPTKFDFGTIPVNDMEDTRFKILMKVIIVLTFIYLLPNFIINIFFN